MFFQSSDKTQSLPLSSNKRRLLPQNQMRNALDWKAYASIALIAARYNELATLDPTQQRNYEQFVSSTDDGGGKRRSSIQFVASGQEQSPTSSDLCDPSY